MTTLANIAATLRRPEYTGENRCLPCTAVNLAIAAGVAGAIALVASGPLGTGGSALLGGAVFGLSAAAIYLRGYLVPGTPWFTRTYFPDRVLGLFDKHPSAAGRAPSDGDLDVEATLKEAGVVTDCADEDDLCLTDGFRDAWHDRVAALRDDDTTHADLAEVLDVDPERLSFEEHGDAFVARLDRTRTGQWESHAAFLADVAAANELRGRYGPWSDLGLEQRSGVLNGLRIFLDRCPSCDGPVTMDQEVVESCCRSIDVMAVTCGDCGARLFETTVSA